MLSHNWLNQCEGWGFRKCCPTNSREKVGSLLLQRGEGLSESGWAVFMRP